MVTFTTRIHKFAKQGEKTGWTYIEITATQALQIKPDTKAGYRVKGKIDQHSIRQVALLPMGEGRFIIPLNATMRKAIGKKEGEKVTVRLSVDESAFVHSAELMQCLEDEPALLKVFKALPGSHQKYYSKWIDSAKTEATKAKRIAMALDSFAKGQNFGEMLRASRGK